MEDHKQLSRDTADQYRVMKAKDEYDKLLKMRKGEHKAVVGVI